MIQHKLVVASGCESRPGGCQEAQDLRLSGITPNGDASVEFVSGAAGDTYDANDVWDAIVSFGDITQC